MGVKTEEKQKKFNFWPYFAKHKVPIIFWLILMAIEIGTQTFYGIFGAYILANISAQLYLLAIKQLIIWFICIIITNILGSIRGLLYVKTYNKVVNEMKIDIAVQAFNLADKAFSNHNTANITQRISSDPQKIFNNIYGFVSLLQQIITTIIMVLYVAIISPLIAIISIVAVGIIYLIEMFRKKKQMSNKKTSFKFQEKTASLLNEIVRSQRDIKSLNLEQKLKENIIISTKNEAQQDVKYYTDNRGFTMLNNIVTELLITGVLILGLWQAHIGLLTLASFMIVYNNRYQLSSLASIFTLITDFSTELSLAVMRINDLYENDEYELEKFGDKTLKKVKGQIQFKNVGFSYVEYREKSDAEIKKEIKFNKKHKIKEKVKQRIEIGKNKVFNNLNFEIQPNTTVSFVGVSGSGKSTILNLISKMYDADKGKVLIDGNNIQKLSKDTIRSSISFVNQFPYIFDMSIKDNLLLAKPDATEDELKMAIEESALTDFIDSLSDGIDTVVGESGIKLSGGQKQRLAIARAMLRKSSIILFDESTSSLDNLAQNKVKESIDKIQGKSTVVIVAHRLSTIKNVDKIFFLENGEIVDSGTFNELFNRNQRFKTMFLAENL